MKFISATLLLGCNRAVSFAPSYQNLKASFSTSLMVGDNGDSYRSDVDEMRRILEESWDVKTMSHIPTNAESGAKAATEAIMNLLHENSNQEPKVIMVDIALPSFDPNFGSFYDDVGAAEFCCELADGISSFREASNVLKTDGKVAIILKNENLVSRTQRFLDDKSPHDMIIEKNDSHVEEYNDFSDFDLPSLDGNQENQPNYIIGSFLGNVDTIPSGSNMINDICKLVSENAIPSAQSHNEDVIIMNCPFSQAELIGVRWLVSKYGSSKTIIIVNNRFNPLPRELMEAITVYSVLPLIARSVSTASSEEKPANPKIVLMRRYPHDWQIYVDDSSGLGFELVSSVAAKNVGVKGPSMDFISKQVKEYMIGRFQK